MPRNGDVIKGKVVKVFPKRAIIDLGNNEAGSLHISHVSKDPKVYVKDINDHIKLGQEVEVRVIGFNRKQNKYDLSIKLLNDDLHKEIRFKEQMEKFLKDSAEKQRQIQTNRDRKQGIKVRKNIKK